MYWLAVSYPPMAKERDNNLSREDVFRLTARCKAAG
jgi:hypothetical protein